MVIEVTTIYACDGARCGATAIVTTEEDVQRFEAEWHNSMTLDLCGACRETEAGKMRIAADDLVRKVVTERHFYGVNS